MFIIESRLDSYLCVKNNLNIIDLKTDLKINLSMVETGFKLKFDCTLVWAGKREGELKEK